MARIELAPGAFDDFDRVFDHTPKSGDPAAATQRIDEIIKAVDVLTHSEGEAENRSNQRHGVTVAGFADNYPIAHRPVAALPPVPHAQQRRMAAVNEVDDAHVVLAGVLSV